MKIPMYKNHLPHTLRGGYVFSFAKHVDSLIPGEIYYPYISRLRDLKSNMDTLLRPNSKATILDLSQADKEYYTLLKEYKSVMYEYAHKDIPTRVHLARAEVYEIIRQSLAIEEGKTLHTFAFTLMDNHYHWVARIYDSDPEGKPVVLPKLLAKLHSIWSRKINFLDGKPGRKVWQNEIFDTILWTKFRIEEAVMYAVQNPVRAGLCKTPEDWPYTICNYRI